MIKKIITIVLTMSLITTFSNITNIYAYEENNKKISNSACGVMTEEPIMDKNYINEKGELVNHFQDNTQVIYHEDGTITVYSPFGTKPESFDATYRSGWIAIGIAVLKIVGGIISTCSAIQYVTGHDICRIVLRYITNPKKTEYSVDAIYHAGYIPGCEPRYSLPCNSGYWEYNVH